MKKRYEFVVDPEDYYGMRVELALKDQKNKAEFIRNAILFYYENPVRTPNKTPQKNEIEEIVEKAIDKKMNFMLEQIQKSLLNIQVVAASTSETVSVPQQEAEPEEVVSAGETEISESDLDNFLEGLEGWGEDLF